MIVIPVCKLFSILTWWFILKCGRSNIVTVISSPCELWSRFRWALLSCIITKPRMYQNKFLRDRICQFSLLSSSVSKSGNRKFTYSADVKFWWYWLGVIYFMMRCNIAWWNSRYGAFRMARSELVPAGACRQRGLARRFISTIGFQKTLYNT